MHVTHVFPRFKEVHGGAEPVIFNLLRCLSNMGVENTLVTTWFPDSLADQLDPRVHLVMPPRVLSPDIGNVLLAGLANLLSTALLPFYIPGRTDVVCFHTETVVPALFVQRLRGRKGPAAYFCYQPPRFAYDTVQETSRSGGFLGRLVPLFSSLYRPFDRFTVRRADAVFTFSTGYRDWIENIYGISGVKVLPPGVEKPAEIPPLPVEIARRLEGMGPVILFVGKLIPWKNVDRLIRVTGVLRERFPGVACLVVGDGPSMPDLRKQAADTGLEENVLFPGYVGPGEVFSYYQAADLFVILEQNISFGLCLVEANACGVPAVAFRAGGPVDIIEDGGNGVLLPPDATDGQVADAIGNVLASPDVLPIMREKSLERAGHFTWEGFARHFMQAVEGIGRDPVVKARGGNGT